MKFSRKIIKSHCALKVRDGRKSWDAVIPKPGTKRSRWHCNIMVDYEGVITNCGINGTNKKRLTTYAENI
jgi:hypothetical protein